MLIHRACFLTAVSLSCFAATAQDDARGHWIGKLQGPNNQTITMELDFDKTAKGWIGSLSIPEQKLIGLILESVDFQAGKLNFVLMKAGDKPPGFTGKLSADGKAITGEMTQGGATLPLTLKRTGEAKVELPKTSPVVPKELTGKWEGTLEAGMSLRLVLNIENKETGAVATLVSVDQGGAKIPVARIDHIDGKVALQVTMVNGGYEGKLNKEGTTLTGDWTQNGNTLPLVFSKK